MSNILKKCIEHKFLIFLCLFCCSLYYVFFAARAHVEMTIELAQRTHFQVYWAQKGENFSESRSKKILISPKQKTHTFYLTDLRNISRLRIDPCQYIGVTTIHKMVIKQRGLEDIVLSTPEQFSNIQTLYQIPEFSIDQNGLKLHSNGKDASFVLVPEIKKISSGLLLESIRWLVICLVVVAIYGAAKNLNKDLRYVPYLLTAVLFLVTVMAIITQRNTHPDEYVHIEASKYYQDNWMPPKIEDPAVRHTYSDYGYSRLNTVEVAYFFTGKFQKLLAIFTLDQYWVLRMFNVSLLIGILFYSIKNPGARPVAAILLISPQIWYVFSYCNSDAFAMFIAFLTSCQLVIPDSMLNTFLRQKYEKKFILYVLVVGGLFGCLLLLKQNYYPFIVFVAVFLLLQIFKMDSKESRKLFLYRLLILVAIGVSLFGLRKGVAYYVNGFDYQAKIIAMSGEIAKPIYSPNTELSKQHLNLHMKARGVSLESLVNKHRWFEKTFLSAFGFYGYFTAMASYTYYDVARWTGLSFLLFFFGSIFIRGGAYRSILAFAGLLLSIALIAAALNSSWKNDFQPQGRYLFPIIPILGVLYAHSLKFINKSVFTLFLLAMFLISSYSFIFVGLFKLNRMVFL